MLTKGHDCPLRLFARDRYGMSQKKLPLSMLLNKEIGQRNDLGIDKNPATSIVASREIFIKTPLSLNAQTAALLALPSPGSDSLAARKQRP